MDNSKVSVIIPFYNDHKTIKRAIDSVLNQTYENIEIIVVDDYSSEPLNLKDERYSNIKVITHKQNKGSSVARNSGVRSANGEYVAFLDADDEYHPDKIYEQLLAIEKNSVVTCEILRIYPNSKNKQIKTKYNIISKFHHIIFRNTVNGAGILIKRKILRKLHLYDEKLRTCEDFDLYLRLIRNNFKIIVVKKPLYLYYFNENSQSRDYYQISMDEIEVLYKNKYYCKNMLEKVIFELAKSGFIFRQYVRAHAFKDRRLLLNARKKCKELDYILIQILLKFVIIMKLHILVSFKIKYMHDNH